MIDLRNQAVLLSYEEPLSTGHRVWLPYRRTDVGRPALPFSLSPAMSVAAITSPRAPDVPLAFLRLARLPFHFHLMLESLDSAPQAFLLRLRTIRCARVRANKCHLVPLLIPSRACATVLSRSHLSRLCSCVVSARCHLSITIPRAYSLQY